MYLYKYYRPKLPRNKYGRVGQSSSNYLASFSTIDQSPRTRSATNQTQEIVQHIVVGKETFDESKFIRESGNPDIIIETE